MDRSSRPAFSLMELIVVLAIMSALAGIAAPRYAGAQVRFRADAAQRRVAEDLRWFARHANATSASVTVNYNTTTHVYGTPEINDPDQAGRNYSVDLTEAPYQVRIASADFAGSASLTFTGHGHPQAGGSVVIAVGDQTRTITVDAITGEVTTP
jgi:prepilin-type N-terminal cleavage/methylation domain-containing protein